MLLLDLSHTCHSRARSGVQRVCRELRRSLRNQHNVTEITHDPHERIWRSLEPWERAPLDGDLPPTQRRGAAWPVTARWRGLARRIIARRRLSETLPSAEGLIVPEIFSPAVANALPPLFDHVRGPRVALFCDAIALRLPQFTPAGTVGRFPSYLDELRRFDGVVAISEDSRKSLLDYWAWAGWSEHPPVVAQPLPCDHLSIDSSGSATTIASSSRPKILSVGSIEGRKNHLTLLAAADQLWSSGEMFELVLVGMSQRESGAAALREIKRLQAAQRPLTHLSTATDALLNSAYRTCRYTVYPSLMEGFGFPVWESLLHGKPCICSAKGALGETAAGGGCLTVDVNDPQALANTMRGLLRDDQQLHDLTASARQRTPRRWTDYARNLVDWMRSLPDRGTIH